MYGLDINFLKDRPSYQKKSDKKGGGGGGGGGKTVSAGDLVPLYIGLAIALSLPILVGGGWLVLQGKNGELEVNIAQLEQENKRLETEIGSINKIREETNKVKGETQALVTVFDQIRPWSATLQDLRDRIPPAVQIETIKQIAAAAPAAPAQGQAAAPPPNPAGGVELTGMARSFNDVNDFLLSLQQSKFLKASESRIVTAELVDAPLPPGTSLASNGVPVKPPQVVKYTIQSSMSDVPASELIRELEQKGTVGLVTRIRTMQQTGIIQK
jgi:type IV pilus assembly protein PilN